MIDHYSPVIIKDGKPFLSKVTQVGFTARYVPVISPSKFNTFASIRVEFFYLDIFYLHEQIEYIAREKSVVSSMSDVERAIELLTIPSCVLLPEHTIKLGEEFTKKGSKDVSIVTFVGKIGSKRHGYLECVSIETHYLIQGTVIEFFSLREFRARFEPAPKPPRIRHMMPLLKG